MPPAPITTNTLFYGDNLDILRDYLASESVAAHATPVRRHAGGTRAGGGVGGEWGNVEIRLRHRAQMH